MRVAFKIVRMNNIMCCLILELKLSSSGKYFDNKLM